MTKYKLHFSSTHTQHAVVSLAFLIIQALPALAILSVIAGCSYDRPLPPRPSVDPLAIAKHYYRKDSLVSPRATTLAFSSGHSIYVAPYMSTLPQVTASEKTKLPQLLHKDIEAPLAAEYAHYALGVLIFAQRDYALCLGKNTEETTYWPIWNRGDIFNEYPAGAYTYQHLYADAALRFNLVLSLLNECEEKKSNITKPN